MDRDGLHEGTDLSHLLELRYPAGMPVGHVIPIITAVASALDYAHKKGLLHRDVKPANTIVADHDTDDPSVFVADFGIARPLDDTSGITTTNMTVGTVAYAAPERLMGEPIDGRADQYALAATIYHLLTGAQLFPHSNPAVVIVGNSAHQRLPSPTYDPNSPRSTRFWLPRWPSILTIGTHAASTSPRTSPKLLPRKPCGVVAAPTTRPAARHVSPLLVQNRWC